MSMSTTFAKQYKAETVARMAENLEHIAQVVSQLELDPPALGLALRNAVFYLREALEVWPVDGKAQLGQPLGCDVCGWAPRVTGE